MIRQSNAAGQPYVDALITPDISSTLPNINGVGCNANGCNAPLPPVTPPAGNGVRMEYTPHNDINPAPQAGLSEPNVWLKLQRSGNTFTSWWSSDGNSWTLIGTVGMSMSGPVSVGLFVTSHNIREYSSAAFDNVQL